MSIEDNQHPSDPNLARERLLFRVYQDAFELSGSERQAFLAEACGEDLAMRQEIEAMLADASKTLATADDVLMQGLAIHAAEVMEQGREDLSGKLLGDYQVERLVGRGGMGVIYKARDTRLGRYVALKVLPPELAGNPERLKRFQREGKLVSILNHPHIVTLFAVESIEGRHLLTMEWIEGQTLAELIPEGGFSLIRLLELAIPMTEALHAAHGAGVMHRDLKPANIMIDDDGTVKVLDFGLAKRDPSSSDELEVSTELATQAGRVMGTYPYMSPEQVSGKSLTHLSDIFSLGVILYEMATGERPFKGENSGELISSILRDDPRSISEINSRVPEHLNRIITHCLVKDPRRRCQSALDLRNALADLKRAVESGELSFSTLRLRLPHRRLWRHLLLGLLLAGLVGFGGWKWYRQSGWFYQARGIEAHEAGDVDAAVSFLRLAVDKNPSLLRSWHTLAKALKDNGHRKQALDAAVKMKELAAGWSPQKRYLAEGTYYMQVLDYERAMKAFRSYDHLRADGEVQRQIANCASMLGQPDTSLHYIEKALSRDPDNAIHIGIKAMALVEAGKGAEAVRWCRQHLVRDIEEKNYLYWPLTLAQLFEGEFAGARQSLTQLERGYPEEPLIQSVAILLRAKSFYLEGDTSRAVAELRNHRIGRLNSLWEEWVNRHLWLARLELKMGNPGEAAIQLDRVHEKLETEPYHQDFIRRLALVEIKLGRMDRLEQCIQRLQSIETRFPSSMVHGFVKQLEAEQALRDNNPENASRAIAQALEAWDDARLWETQRRIYKALNEPARIEECNAKIDAYRGLIIRDDWPDLLVEKR